MNRKISENTQMLTGMAEFAASNVGLFPPNLAAAEVATALQSGARKLSDKAAARIAADAAMAAAKNARAASREKLRSFFTRASLIAEALGATVRIPVQPTERVLISCSHAFIEDLESMPAAFAKHGVAPDDVRASLESLQNAIRDYTNAKAVRAAAMEESAKALEETMNTLKLFDALVAGYLADNAGAMALY